jgi:hypothetical protein
MTLPQDAIFRRERNTGPIPFPRHLSRRLPEARGVLEAIDGMSRRIEDLARELNCLGYFDRDDDRPRAA